ncbi:MAG: hypothetical protein ACPG7F_10570 [Aggregatilineales bacterium]
MERTTVIDNKHVVMYYYPDEKLVHHIYQPTIHGKFVREQLTQGIELLKEHNATKWLSDNHLFNDLPEEDNIWINENWLPSAVEAGWKYWALVVPTGFIGKMNMTQFVNNFSDMGVMVRVFTSPDDAMDWLKQM